MPTNWRNCIIDVGGSQVYKITIYSLYIKLENIIKMNEDILYLELT